jgi:hypothetical protein
MPEQKLNLFEFAAGNMTESGAGAAIMPHAAFVAMPNPGLCRMLLPCCNLARIPALLRSGSFGIIGSPADRDKGNSQYTAAAKRWGLPAPAHIVCAGARPRWCRLHLGVA